MSVIESGSESVCVISNDGIEWNDMMFVGECLIWSGLLYDGGG
jgi:hypothetical protein